MAKFEQLYNPHHSQNQMKVVVVLPYLTSIGGAARYGWEFSEYLASRGDSVLIVSLYTDRDLYRPKENIAIVDLEDKTRLTQSIWFWFNLGKISRKLSHLIKKERPDIVFFNHFPSTMWVQKYDGIPSICYPQDINLLYTDTYINDLPAIKRLPWQLIRQIIRIYDKRKWRCFDQVVCNSKFSSNHISKFYDIDPKIIYPGTNTRIFKKDELVTKQKAILSMGDIKLRRADLLIKAAASLRKKRNDFEIWIVGSKGRHDEELKKLVDKYGLKEIVRFFGRVADSKLAKLYSESLAVTHLIKEAPFGLIVIEAMACETAVVAWKPSGAEETIVQGETGFLIRENDEDDLIKSVEKLLDEPQLAVSMGKKARARVLEYFEMETQYCKLRELMQNMLTKP